MHDEWGSVKTCGKIHDNDITILLGDIATIQTSAYVVPQFSTASSYGGIAGAIGRSGGKTGLDQFQEFVSSHGKQKIGSVLLTESGGGLSKYQLHTVSLGTSDTSEFEIVKTAFFNALKVAEANHISKIAAPAMGTGVIGQLTAGQSARAMMSALEQYSLEGGSPIEICFVIFGDKEAFTAFAQSLHTKTYIATNNTIDQTEANNTWMSDIKRTPANESFLQNHKKRDPNKPDGSGWTKSSED